VFGLYAAGVYNNKYEPDRLDSPLLIGPALVVSYRNPRGIGAYNMRERADGSPLRTIRRPASYCRRT
jgi:hypothetical protein